MKEIYNADLGQGLYFEWTVGGPNSPLWVEGQIPPAQQYTPLVVQAAQRVAAFIRHYSPK